MLDQQELLRAIGLAITLIVALAVAGFVLAAISLKAGSLEWRGLRDFFDQAIGDNEAPDDRR